MTIFLVKGEK